MELKNKDKVKKLLTVLDNIDSAKDTVDILKKVDYAYCACNLLGSSIVSIIRYYPNFDKTLMSFLDNIKNDIKEQLKDL